MLMRITRGQLHPGTWKALERAYRTTIVAKGAAINGLRGHWLVQDAHDPDTVYAVSLWESRREMQAYEHSPLYTQEVLPALQPYMVGACTTTYGAVRVIQAWEDELGPYNTPPAVRSPVGVQPRRPPARHPHHAAPWPARPRRGAMGIRENQVPLARRASGAHGRRRVIVGDAQ